MPSAEAGKRCAKMGICKGGRPGKASAGMVLSGRRRKQIDEAIIGWIANPLRRCSLVPNCRHQREFNSINHAIWSGQVLATDVLESRQVVNPSRRDRGVGC